MQKGVKYNRIRNVNKGQRTQQMCQKVQPEFKQDKLDKKKRTENQISSLRGCLYEKRATPFAGLARLVRYRLTLNFN